MGCYCSKHSLHQHGYDKEHSCSPQIPLYLTKKPNASAGHMVTHNKNYFYHLPLDRYSCVAKFWLIKCKWHWCGQLPESPHWEEEIWYYFPNSLWYLLEWGYNGGKSGHRLHQKVEAKCWRWWNILREGRSTCPAFFRFHFMQEESKTLLKTTAFLGFLSLAT